MQLTDQNLFRQQAYIDGAWADADSAAPIHVTHPVDNSVLATIPDMCAAATRPALIAASKPGP